MRQSKFLDKLLEGSEVGWLPLGEVSAYEQPTKYLVKTKNYSDDWETPVLTAGKTFILGYTNETHGIYAASKSPVIIFDDFTTANKWVDFDFKAKSSAMKMITSKDDSRVLIKYIYYWLNTLPSGLIEGDHKRQWISNYCHKKIPIPCPDDQKKSLAIQAEIVRILDNFTTLEAELEAELEARRKQYQYYRDALLSCDQPLAGSDILPQNVEWLPLDKVGRFIRGRRFTKEDYAPKGIPCIHYGDIYTQYGTTTKTTVSHVRSSMKSELKYAAPGDVVIAGVGETVEDVGKAVAWLGDSDVAIHDDCCALHHSHNPTYIAYCFQLSAFHAEKQKYVARGKVKRVGSKNLAKVSIPIPYPDDPEKSLAEQARIVDILDKFDALVNDLTDGVPAEISARRKQYEYYRDQLLTFPQAEEAAA